MEKLDQEMVAQAITEGVREAFAAMFNELSMPHVIGDGVMVGVSNWLNNNLSVSDITEAIQEGTFNALDQCWPSQILGAISEGTEEAMKANKK